VPAAPPAPHDDADAGRGTDPTTSGATATGAPVGRQALRRALAPRPNRAQLMAAVLCALLGFALVVQVRQTNVEGLSVLRQSDLVRILDETTQRASQLERESAALERTKQSLLTGSNQQEAALAAARQTATTLGILSGRLPAEGPGIELTISESSTGHVPALTLFNVLEELRNAGAEALQVNDHRIVASSHFVDGPAGVELDGVALTAPFRWIVIGPPDTMAPALEIPGGAMAAVRTVGGRGTTVSRTKVEVDALHTIAAPEFATPVPDAAG